MPPAKSNATRSGWRTLNGWLPGERSPDLGLVPDMVLIDGNWDFAGTGNTVRIVRGDAYCLSIAAASMLAKVTRDRHMRAVAPNYPHYEFQDNKGYPCWRHKMALQAYGPCTIHRRTWVFMDSLSWDMRHRRAMPATAARGEGGSGRVIIEVQDLRKNFGAVEALRGVDFAVPEGKVLGLLGPNGAGKTTAVRILTTLLAPSGGRAAVCGFDVAHDPAAVRRVIGLAGQATAITPDLTGFENLEVAGRLYHLGKATARQRARELLTRFDLNDATDRRPRPTRAGCCGASTWPPV